MTDQQITPDAIKFRVDGLEGSNGVVCVKTSAAPKSVKVGEKSLDSKDYDFADGLLRIRFVNSSAGNVVDIERRSSVKTGIDF